MDWTSTVIALLVAGWFLYVGLKPRTNPTVDDFKSVFNALRFLFQYRKYIREKYFVQERTRNSNQQLCESENRK